MDKASAGVKKVLGAVKETEAFQMAEGAVGVVTNTAAFHAIETAAEDRLEDLRDFEHQQKRRIAAIIYNKLDKMFMHSMAILNVKTKAAVKDPYMPDCVQNMVDSTVDCYWPDITNEAKGMLLTQFIPKQLYHGDAPCCRYTPRILFRYWMMPYDRTIWRIMRNPFWWFWTLAALVPKYGITQMIFTITFLMIDKRDDFQLQQFIVRFKGTQFVSLGIASCIVGMVQYYLCVTATETKDLPYPVPPPSGAPMANGTRAPPPTGMLSTEGNICAEYAPQEDPWTVLMFVWQIILVWIAFLMLRWSKSKGGEFYHFKNLGIDPLDDGKLTMKEAIIHENFVVANAEADEEGRKAAKRRLRNFLLYDLAIFTIMAFLTAFAALHPRHDPDSAVTEHDDGVQNWKFRAALYVLKVGYGLLSFPFVILAIPGLNTLVSHAKPTAYNPYGKTVVLLGEEEDGPLPWAPNRPTKEHRIAEERRRQKMAAQGESSPRMDYDNL